MVWLGLPSAGWVRLLGKVFRLFLKAGVWLLRAQIKLSTKSFGTDAAEVAARGIANVVTTLEEADLSDVIAGLLCRKANPFLSKRI